FAVLDEGCSVGQGSQIFPQVYVGDRVRIGSNCKICAGVKIYEDCVLGDNITIHSGTVIGGDGFGFAPTEDGSFQKIPQIGNVVIEDDVEIGANTCIDRATMGSTIIRRGVKLDNQIQIAHNVVVGSNTVMAAQVGVAGSAKIGQNVMMGGQVGVVGHITIADGVKIGSQSGIGASVDKPGVVMFGSPAMPGLQNHRVHAILKELPELRAKLLKVVREMETLKNNGNS
ncbi:MAG: UDP-3-O-(3-hydroxymyristoyl)glucosamine N-acyltransferase, partial [Mucinivorans sp.]